MLRVGKLQIVGERFRFEMLESAFRTRAGEPLEIGLLYDYEEASFEREDMRLLFEVQMDGEPPVVTEAHVADRPVVHDQQYGLLACEMRAPPSGLRGGRWSVQAFYLRGKWFSANEKSAHFRTDGRFLLEVA